MFPPPSSSPHRPQHPARRRRRLTRIGTVGMFRCQQIFPEAPRYALRSRPFNSFHEEYLNSTPAIVNIYIQYNALATGRHSRGFSSDHPALTTAHLRYSCAQSYNLSLIVVIRTPSKRPSSQAQEGAAGRSINHVKVAVILIREPTLINAVQQLYIEPSKIGQH